MAILEVLCRFSRPAGVSARGLVVPVLGGLLWVSAGMSQARAADWTKRWAVGVRLGEYLHVDKQKGGFRYVSGGLRGGASGQTVSIENGPLGSLSIGRGIKKWDRVQLVVELEVSRISGAVGKETVYLDPDGSTRVEDPITAVRSETGDEGFETRVLGDLTMTPVFVNALFHWSGKANPERADFYFGGGLGVVMADFAESEEYKEFANEDSTPDVQVDNAFAVIIKTGANVRLAKNHDWFLYFEAEFFATGLVTSESQVSWTGVDYLAGTRMVDTDNNGVPDVTVPADYRLMDPGHIRMDGAIAGIGLRYRFGGGAQAVAPPSSSAADIEAPEP